MTRALGNGLIKTLADTIGTGAVGKLAKQIAGVSTDVANIKTPDKGSGLMFNPDTGKLYIPCGNGVAVNKNTGMLEVPIGEHLRYTSSGLDVPDADETTAGVVKITHEVSNRDDGERAITADGVYAYAPGYKTRPTNVQSLVNPLNGIMTEYAYVSNGFFICMLKTRKTISAGDDVLTIEGYDTPINMSAMYLMSPSGGSEPVTTVIITGGGPITISVQDDVTAENVYIAIPVYKI